MHRLCFGSLPAILIFSLLLTAVGSAHYELGLVPASACLSDDVFAPRAQVTPKPGTMFDPTDRLAPPPMSDPPTQVELGHYAYYLSCMVCHGDRGQGLTEEWRGALDPADQNCWQSKCHAANHPPEGFELPRNAPPIIGPDRLGHYQTAAGLYEYLKTRMPWQAPGILSDEEYWQLTAFLIDVNGVPLGDTILGPDNAANVHIEPQAAAAEASSKTDITTTIMPHAPKVERQMRHGLALNLTATVGVLLMGGLVLSILILRRRHDQAT
jgi:hypothetical protein